MAANFNSLWSRFFGRDDSETSKYLAKERLRLVLVHDRLDISEQVMDALRVDMLAVISKYFSIDEQALEVKLTRESEGIALVANMPISGARRDGETKKANSADTPAAAKPAPAANQQNKPANKPGHKQKPGEAKNKSPNKPAPAPPQAAEHVVEAFIK